MDEQVEGDPADAETDAEESPSLKTLAATAKVKLPTMEALFEVFTMYSDECAVSLPTTPFAGACMHAGSRVCRSLPSCLYLLFPLSLLLMPPHKKKKPHHLRHHIVCSSLANQYGVTC